MKAFDPNTWKEKFNEFGDWLREKFEETGAAWDKAVKDFGEWFIPLAKDFGDWTGLNRDGKYHVYDPLVLDLDGDGIETVGTQGYAGALFDHDKDGIRTSTGWVAADDGLLVVDRNSDGLINNGDELFGDSHTLKDGTHAAHGYAALAEFDSNGDGKVDAQDADFDKLKVWRDLDQDGISDAGELFTLAELNIQSLDTAYKDVNKTLGNGNTLAQEGSYTLADGSSRQMGDLLLATDKLHSRYTDKIELTEAQMQTANLQGIGRLRDLREAAALSPKLAEVLKAYSQAETQAEQKALVDTLVGEWAKTDPKYGGNIVFAAPYIRTANEGMALTPSQEKELHSKLYISSKEYLDMVDKTWHKIAALDSFSGEKSNTIYVRSDQDIAKFFGVANKAYDALTTNVYQALLLQTRLKPYMDEITFKIEGEELALDYAGIEQKFAEVYAANPEKGFVDLGSMLAHSKLNQWHQGRSLFEDWIKEAKEQGVFEQRLEALGKDAVELLTRTNGGDKDDVLQALSLKGNGNVSLYGGKGDDTLIDGRGNNYLYGNEGSDVYVFGKNFGSDRIIDNDTSESTDIIRFTAHTQNDLHFRRSGDNLIIEAKEGGDDVTVQNYFYGKHYATDGVVFSDGTKLDKAAVDLLAQQGREEADYLYAYAEGSTLNGLGGNDYLYGAEGSDTFNGGSGNDTLYGRDGNDALNGGEGNDILKGEKGNDTLEGGEGNDYLYGNEGRDTLKGGTGNDYLYGGNNEADTYVFAKGHGQDTVSDYGSKAEHIDTLLFENAEFSDAVFSRLGSDLVVKAYGGDDQVSVKNFFSNENYRYAAFEFTDKTVTSNDVMAAVV